MGGSPAACGTGFPSDETKTGDRSWRGAKVKHLDPTSFKVDPLKPTNSWWFTPTPSLLLQTVFVINITWVLLEVSFGCLLTREGWISYPIQLSHQGDKIRWVHEGTWEDGETGVQMLPTGGRLGYSKSSPLFSSLEKKYYNGSFSETAIVSSNTDICLYSEYLFGKCHELSHSKKDHFVKWTFLWLFNPQNSSLKEDPHSLEHWFQMTESTKYQKPRDLRWSPSLPKQNVFSTLTPLASTTTCALQSTKQDLDFETRYKFRQKHQVISKRRNYSIPSCQIHTKI